MPIGLTMPLARNTGSLGYLDFSTTEIEATHHNLRSLLLTDWGERPNHYYLGCNLSEFLFAQGSQELSEKVVQRVYSQVNQWLPYVILNSVTASYPESNRLSVRVDFSLRGRQDMSSVLEVEVAGG